MAAVEVLVVNLDRAPARWAHMRAAIAAALPAEWPVVRVPATDGAALDDDALRALVAPGVLAGIRRRARICDPCVLDTVAAVGASCSHLRCWERVAAAADPHAVALVLEDDACVTPELAAAVAALAVAPRPMAWDAVLLGWTWMPSSHWRGPRRPAPPGAVPGVPGLRRWERDSCGAHAYVVSHAGARRLCAHARPLELHVDHYLGVAAVLGLVRGYAWPDRLAHQCLGPVEAAIPHWQGWRTVNARLLLPDAPLGAVLLILLLVIVTASVNGRRM